MAPTLKTDNQGSPRSSSGGEIRVPTVGTWVGLGAAILVVIT